MPKDGQALDNSESNDFMFTSVGAGGNHSLSYRIRLLHNKIFYERYILRNARGLYSSLLGLNSSPSFAGKIAGNKRLKWM